MNHKPFLSIVIRTCKRPKALKRCLDSLVKQDRNDFEVVIIRDEFGRGVPWANGMLAELDWSNLDGRYVYLLDDDNTMTAGAIRAIKKAVDDCDMLICRINRLGTKYQRSIGDRLWPEDDYWKKQPQVGHIDIGCVVLRHGLFIEAVKYFTHRYEGDFDFINAAYVLAKSVNWLNIPIQDYPTIGAGVTEHD